MIRYTVTLFFEEKWLSMELSNGWDSKRRHVMPPRSERMRHCRWIEVLWRPVLSDSESPEVQGQWLNRRFTAPVQTVFSRFDKKKMFKCDFDEESKTKEGKELDWVRCAGKQNQTGPVTCSVRRFFGLTETSGPVLITIPFLWLSISWRVVTGWVVVALELVFFCWRKWICIQSRLN